MSYPAKSIANAFLVHAREHGVRLTNMQVQKLVFFAHGWHLALKGEPLVSDAVKAWNFGPVIPPLYNALKRYGNGEVSDLIEGADVPTDQFVLRLIAKVFELYGRLSGAKLSALTHRVGSAWDKAYKDNRFSVISDEMIMAEFKAQLQRG